MSMPTHPGVTPAGGGSGGIDQTTLKQYLLQTLQEWLNVIVSSEGGGGTSIVEQIEIAAPVDAVWQALTDPTELTRWLPLDAKVTPGQGGSIWLSWGDPVVQQSTIDVWQPNQRLRITEVTPFGAPFQPKEAAGVTRTIDYTLQSTGQKTTFRMEHAGFGTGAAWTPYVESLRSCHAYQVRSLAHYLEQHRGQVRTVAWARASSTRSFTDAWSRITGPQALVSQGSIDGLSEGDRYSVTAANGDTFTGVVVNNTPSKQFAGTVENMNNSLHGW